jgi:hypothetical protein
MIPAISPQRISRLGWRSRRRRRVGRPLRQRRSKSCSGTGRSPAAACPRSRRQTLLGRRPRGPTHLPTSDFCGPGDRGDQPQGRGQLGQPRRGRGRNLVVSNICYGQPRSRVQLTAFAGHCSESSGSGTVRRAPQPCLPRARLLRTFRWKWPIPSRVGSGPSTPSTPKRWLRAVTKHRQR